MAIKVFISTSVSKSGFSVLALDDRSQQINDILHREMIISILNIQDHSGQKL